MQIKGIENLTGEDIDREPRHGARFVMFTYTISVIVMTFRRSSDIFSIRAGQGAFSKGIGFTFISLILGRWGIPWGLFYTIGSVVTHCSGGKNVTEEVLASIPRS